MWSLTLMFLSIWNYIRPTDTDYDCFPPQPVPEARDRGRTAMSSPSPTAPWMGRRWAALLYLNLINKAQRYVYIATPYLIIDNRMITALTVAAKSGVDVRIITPMWRTKWFCPLRSPGRIMMSWWMRGSKSMNTPRLHPCQNFCSGR